jgi:hypothetical protein
MGCVKEGPKLKNMFSVVLRNVVLLYPCIGKSSTLKVHKRENFLGFDFEICTFS